MVHHQDVTVELSTRLLAAQCEIEILCIQLRNSNATIRGYMRMVDGQAWNLYTSDMDTWLATSTVQGSGKEPAVDSRSPSGSRTRSEPTKLCRESLACVMFDVLVVMLVSVDVSRGIAWAPCP
jgi:hypothetical protein